MNTVHRLSLPALVLPLLLGATLGACTKLDVPATGDYRAALNLKGGELPLTVSIAPAADPARSAVTVNLLQATQPLAATQVEIRDGHLIAQWPDIGTLDARFDQSGLNGELRMTNAQGQPVALPLRAQLNQPWRYVEQSGTDNADTSGMWQLEAISTEHFNVPVSMQLHQQHDLVDGQLTLPDGRTVPVIGQVRGDDVFLGTLGYGRATLLKGKVNSHGELQGEFWVNTGSAHPWVARRQQDQAANTDEAILRQVGLPWAVPTR